MVIAWLASSMSESIAKPVLFLNSARDIWIAGKEALVEQWLKEVSNQQRNLLLETESYTSQ